jgi:ABC-2 type transport system permease protein
MSAVVALAERNIWGSLRDLDLVFAVIVPVVMVIGLNGALRNVIDTGGMSYLQYVLPAVVVQAMLFGALTTTARAAQEQISGFGSRLRTLPISPYASLAARMVYCLLRGGLALVAAMATAYVLGFRMQSGFGYLLMFALLSLVLTLAVSLGADATGARAKRAEVASQLLMVPQMLIVLLSTGLAPVDAFPSWLQWFVHYQPVSQITETLRDFTVGQVEMSNLISSVAWCVGLLLVFGTIAVRTQRRRQ